MVKGDGQLKTFDKEEELKAVRASLGLFGVIVEITIRLETNFKVKVTNEYPTIEEFFANSEKLEKCLKDNFSVQIYWYPYNSISIKGIYSTLVHGKLPKEEWNADQDKLWVRTVKHIDERYSISYMQYLQYVHICISYTTAEAYMGDIYSVTSYRYFGGTFRIAHLASGWFCLNADNFIECSCPDYSNCPKCKENCPPSK